MEYNFGELKNDVNFVSNVQAASDAVEKIERAIKNAGEVKLEDLSTEERVTHDIFLAYTINSLYWMFLKVNGENPSAHGIKHELSRIKEAMERKKQIHDHKTIRPVIQQDVAKRMVRGGLYDFKKKNEDFKKISSKIHIHSNPNPQSKKRKFSSD